jgi:TolA-binding protein
MLIIMLIVYAAIITLLFICALIGASAQNQDAACIIKNDRIVVKDFIDQLSEAKGRISELEAENCKLQEVISRQDRDIETCHQLMEMRENAELRGASAAKLITHHS